MMYANVEKILSSVTTRVWKPRSKPPVDQWCDEHRTLPSEGVGGAKAGRWDTSETPYLREPLRRSMDPEVREVAFVKSTQVGATELLICIALYEVAVQNKSLLYVYPNAKKGAKFVKRRLVPAIKNCPPTAQLLALGGTKAATVDEINLGGNIISTGYTGGADSLRSDPIGVVLFDEMDAFDYSGEDPIENGRSRQTTFADSLMWKVSTPMDDQAGVQSEYDQADVRWTYQTPCSKCGAFFELFDFSHIQWMRGLKASPQIAAANCWLKCPCCEKRINLGDHRWMIQHGIWITQGETIISDGSILDSLNPDTRELADGFEMLSMIGSDAFVDQGEDEDPLRQASPATSPGGPGEAKETRCGGEHAKYGVRIIGHRAHGPRHGYRICTMQSLVSADGIRGLVYDFVKANGRPDPTWWRDRMGQSPSTKGERVEITDIKELCIGRELGGHSFGECPPWTAGLFGGIDCQKDCIKLLINAYGALGKKKALVYTKMIPRREELRFTDVLEQLLILPSFGVVDGERRLSASFFVDTGFWTHEVYELLRELGRTLGPDRFVGCKGMSSPETKLAKPYVRSSVHETEGPNGQKYTTPISLELVNVNGHYYKDILAKNLTPISDEYKKQLREQCQTDEEYIDKLDAIVSYQLPGYDSWPDADSVIAELAAEELVLIGSGSGRSGKDGLGRLRQVWRKRGAHRKNDFTDCAVYADACAMRWGVGQWTDEMVDEAINQSELAARGIQRMESGYQTNQDGEQVGRMNSRRPDTIAGDVADPSRFKN